jgi:cation transport ATPase
MRLARQFRSNPEALDRFLKVVQVDQDTSPEDIAVIRSALVMLRRIDQTNNATYAMDRYLVGGMGAIDVVLLAVAVPFGMRDEATTIALFALAISLVLVGASLFIAFIKQELKLTDYGRIHSLLMAGAPVSGFIALTATFWHISSLLGIFFGACTIIVFAVCTAYAYYLRNSAAMKMEEAVAQLAESPAPEPESGTSSSSEPPTDI